MSKGRGGGKTPKRVTEELQKAVNKSSIRAVARESGLTQSAIHRYLQGIGEPSANTFNRLSEYLGLSVEYLRGERTKRIPYVGEHPDIGFYYDYLRDLVEIYMIVPERLKQALLWPIEDQFNDVIEFISNKGEGLIKEHLNDLFCLMDEAIDIIVLGTYDLEKAPYTDKIKLHCKKMKDQIRGLLD